MNSSSSRAVPATPQSRVARAARRPPPQTPSSASLSPSLSLSPTHQRATETAATEKGKIWGTTVDLSRIEKSISDFLDHFKSSAEEPDEDGKGPKLFYLERLKESILSSQYFVDIDVQDVRQSDEELYGHFVAYPTEIIQYFDQALQDRRAGLLGQLLEDDPELDLQDDPTKMHLARPFNLPESCSMRSLNPAHIDTLVSIRGLVIRCSSLIPEMMRAHFVCTMCQHALDVDLRDGEIAEPTQCFNASCRTRFSYRLIHNRCLFLDKQIVKLQEDLEQDQDAYSAPKGLKKKGEEGSTPHSVAIHVHQGLVDLCQPGDRVQVTGIFRADAQRLNPRQRALHAVFRTHLDGLHIALQKEGQGDRASFSLASVSSLSSPSTLSESELEHQLQELGKDPRIYERLVYSLAPTIFEMDEVKKGLLCLLFGGAGAEDGASRGKFRGEINVLMCGDPGTSKSQLLLYVHQLAPRGLYTSGKGSSAVGLTASVTQDVESREMVLESGALVLSDRGVCCIDEFDKMSDSTRSILHEVMEQQTVSIAKAGIVCTLNARTSILASANPKESRYNPRLSVVENIQIMPTLLSRFDLIYLILDQPNLDKDRKLARHLCELYVTSEEKEAMERQKADKRARLATATSLPPLKAINQAMLKAYIAYARKHVRPVLSDEAKDLLVEAYVAMRKSGQQGHNKVVTATPRQLEALIRLSESLARMQLRTQVTSEHVNEARRLMLVATASAATDPLTGRIDLDLLMTGHSAQERRTEQHVSEALYNALESLSSNGTTVMRVARLVEQANINSDAAISDEQARRAIADLVAEGRIAYAGRGQDQVRKI